jgi:hypothetical protein
VRRDQLEHAIRTACQIAGLAEVIIVGSREKDQNFVEALTTTHLVDPAVIAARLTEVPERYRAPAQRAANWLARQAKRAE